MVKGNVKYAHDELKGQNVLKMLMSHTKYPFCYDKNVLYRCLFKTYKKLIKLIRVFKTYIKLIKIRASEMQV